MLKKMIFPLLALALATLACGLQVDLPARPTPAPDVTEQIEITRPAAENVSLTLNFGAGKLRLSPGATETLVSGTAVYNRPDFKPEVTVSGSDVVIENGDYRLSGFPSMNDIKNEWDLQLGAQPMALTVQAGAYEGGFDLGGLALTNLTIRDGASELEVNFSSSNPERMNVFKVNTGASNVTLLNLANANFTSLVFEGGAGNYKLEFGGALTRDASVSIRAGMSNVNLVIPSGMVAQITLEKGLSNVQMPSGWAKSGDTYTQPGEGPMLTIVVEVGAGNLQVTR